ncbi:response regulator [Noviherbaspirillum sp.]|jgi:two-component system chemotaxis response regulator CheY|uniref:response regulator n=1 Tax=Noviherbaspirillum sp. TaxID=1926288 RepID=UPI0025FEDD94|nr:response regulator [Noviherbaspirillum sp.]
MKPSQVSVLVIDDNDVSRAMLRHILMEHKYDVVGVAGSGQLGLELAAKLRPKLICLDITMPDCSGLDVLKRIREQLPGTEVLMVTGNSDRASVMEAVQHGAAGYIVKPFNPTTLLRTIEQVEFT